MSKRYEIIDIKVGVDGNNHDYFSAFVCKDSQGNRINIDPLTSDSFDCETEELDQWEIVEWARGKIGKQLHCADTLATGYIAVGKASIT